MIFIGELQQGAIGADGDDPQGDRLAASSQSSVGGVLQPAAAGDLHAQQGDALDGIGRENGGELFGVVVGIQLGTADEGDMSLHEVPVEISIGVGGAIGGDEQMRAGKAGRPGGDQADLAGPLGQLRGDSAIPSGSGLPLEQLGGGTGTAMEGGLLLGHVLLHGGFIVGGGFPLHKGDGPGGTGGQAVAQTIAVVIAQQAGLALHHADGALVAGSGADAAAGAFFLIYLDNSTDHRTTSLR